MRRPRLIGFLVLSHIARGNQSRFMVYGAAINGCMSLLYLVPMALAAAATVQAVSANLLGRSATIVHAYAAVWRRWYRYVLAARLAAGTVARMHQPLPEKTHPETFLEEVVYGVRSMGKLH